MSFDPADILDGKPEVRAEGAAAPTKSPSASSSEKLRVVRELTVEDAQHFADKAITPYTLPSLAKIQHTHHQAAQLMAQGRDLVEVAAMTGYTAVRLSQFKQDPAFQDLLAYYGSQRELVFIDVMERMKALGVNALDELQAKLADEPGKFSNRELMEMADLMLLKPHQVKSNAQGQGQGGGVTVNVKFVSRAEGPAGDSPSSSSSLIIDGKAE